MPLSGRLGLGEIYVFAIFMVAAVVLLLSMLYMINSVRGFITREVNYAALASSSRVSLIPQSPPLVDGNYIYVNASLEGNLGIINAGSLSGYALCTIKLPNGVMYYTQASVSYGSVNGVINVNFKCPLSIQGLSNLTQLTITLPTPLGSGVKLTFNYRPSIRVFEYPQYPGSSNAVVGLYIYNNSTGWVYINASVIGINGYRVKLGSVMVPPESSTILLNYTPINSPIMTLSYTINNFTTINESITMIPLTYCPPGKVAFAYLGNGTSNMLNHKALGGDYFYWNYMIYNGTVNDLINPIYAYAVNTSNASSSLLILYYDLATYDIPVIKYPMVSAVIYPTQYSINGTIFFIFIVVNKNGQNYLIVIYKSSNVNSASGTALSGDSMKSLNNLLSSYFNIKINNIIDVSNGTIFSNIPLYYSINLSNPLNGLNIMNSKYKYVGFGIYLINGTSTGSNVSGQSTSGGKGKGKPTSQIYVNVLYYSYGDAYWDYLCIANS